MHEHLLMKQCSVAHALESARKKEKVRLIHLSHILRRWMGMVVASLEMEDSGIYAVPLILE